MSLPPFRVLTVCVGNVCRSPLAERLLRLHLAEAVRAGRLEVASAGVGAVVGRGVHELSLAELTRLGGSGEGFSARQLAATDVAGADLVLTATLDVRGRVLREDPAALRRTFTLAELAAVCAASPDLERDLTAPHDLVAHAAAHRALASGADLDLPDPIGRPAAVHREVADRVDAQVREIAARLAPLLTSGARP